MYEQDKQWEYMEIVKFIAADENEMTEGVSIIDSLGKKTKKFDSTYPNIISILNDYGLRGWELINVREIESNDEKRKMFSSIETYTLKREII